MNNNGALVVYHDKCLDGFGAAWVAQKYLTRNRYVVSTYAATYQQEFPWYLLEGVGIVYILDFSYPAAVLQEIVARGTLVVLLDHHKSAQEMLGHLVHSSDRGIKVVFDMEMSGAMLAWKYFNANEPAPMLIEYIQDYDLYRFKLESTKAMNAYLRTVPLTFRQFDVLHSNMEFHEAASAYISQGRAILKAFDMQVEQIIASCKEPCVILGETGLVCNANAMFASEVGHRLAVMSETFGATYYKESNGDVKWSLRSNDDYDVSALAKQFGGGGHKNAAGFTLKASTDTAVSGVTLWNVSNSETEKSTDSETANENH